MSLFWTVDEDGEVVHRLQNEWDGNKGSWKEWGDWRSAGDNWQINIGASWSRWGIGFDYEWNYEGHWADGAHHDYRRQSLTFTLGPWYVSWMRCKPRPLRRPMCDAAGCNKPAASHIVEWHEAEPFACDEHYTATPPARRSS